MQLQIHQLPVLSTGRCRARGGNLVLRCRAAAGSERKAAEPPPSRTSMMLECADKEMSEACSVKPTKEEQEQCWEVHEFFTKKRAQALVSDEDMDRLVDEVSNAGGPDQLIRVLSAEKSADDKAAAGIAVGNSSSRQSPVTQRNEAARGLAMQLFSELDTDGNGVIDREEFFLGMHRLKRELSDDQIIQIFSCMDSHGHVNPEQFADIVQEELDLVDPASDAELLRHLHHEPPGWWTQPPRCVDEA